MASYAQHKRRCITRSQQASKKHNGFPSTPTLVPMLYSILLRAMLRTTRSPQGEGLIVWSTGCVTVQLEASETQHTPATIWSVGNACHQAYMCSCTSKPRSALPCHQPHAWVWLILGCWEQTKKLLPAKEETWSTAERCCRQGRVRTPRPRS